MVGPRICAFVPISMPSVYVLLMMSDDVPVVPLLISDNK